MRNAGVTVLMPVFNAQATVGAAIESILGQTYPDFEFLLIDDGSTDATPRLLEEYASRDARIRVHRNPRNSGVSASMNAGWRAASGEFIARMDADDESHPDRLAEELRLLESRPDVAVVGSAAEVMDEAGTTGGVVFLPEDHETLARQIYEKTPFFNSSVMMRKSFLEALGGYDEKLKRSEDADLWLRGYRRFRFCNLQRPLLRYRERRKPALADLYWGPFVIARSGARERRWLTGVRCAFRWLIVTSLRIAGFRRSSLVRRAEVQA